MIVSFEFSQCFHYLCFRGQEFISDIPSKLPSLGDFENPGQLSVQDVLRGSGDCVL